MKAAREHRTGKGHRDENFPVASLVIEARHRGPILAFYEFVRIADDIADHPTLSQDEKLAQLDRLEVELKGNGDAQPEAVRLREALAECGLSAQHPCDVLTAFRMDVTKLRYGTWNELIHYCTYSAMPVGRFVLDVHEESKATWAASDALCAALQVINHIQDCGDDYRKLDRVYIPSEAMAATGMTVEMVGAERASSQMIATLRGMTTETERLLEEGLALAPQVNNTRLALEIGVIQTYAARILRMLNTRDPLCERVHLNKGEIIGLALMSLAGGLGRRAMRRFAVSGQVSQA